MTIKWIVIIMIAVVWTSATHAADPQCPPNRWVRSETSCLPLKEYELPFHIFLSDHNNGLLVETSQHFYSKKVHEPRWRKSASVSQRNQFLIFSGNGQVALTLNHFDSLKNCLVWNTDTRNIQSKFHIEHSWGDFSLSNDGKLLTFTHPYEDVLEFWNTTNGTKLSWTLQRESSVDHAVIIGNDHCLLAETDRLSYFQLPVQDEHPKRLWEKKLTESTPRNSGSSIRGSKPYFNTTYSEDRATIAQIHNNVLTVINAQDGATLGRHTIDHVYMREAAISHDSKFVAVTFSLPMKSPLDEAEHPKPVNSILLPSEGGFYIYSIETGESVYQSGVISLPQGLVFSRTRNLLFVVLWDGTVIKMAQTNP